MVTTRERKAKAKTTKRPGRPRKVAKKKVKKKAVKKNAAKKKKAVKKIEPQNAIKEVIADLKAYALDPESSLPRSSMDDFLANMDKIKREDPLEARNIKHIAKSVRNVRKKFGVMVHEPVGQDDFWSDLSDRLTGNTLTLSKGGKIRVTDVLGVEVFDALEKQISEAHLDYMRAKRRMVLLNKLMDSAYALIDEKLSPILAQIAGDNV
ncbi:hypothetical protein LCGC14_0426980 [marine sediment metagenome]|uniref:Uncharacterized protein n=1 Tax=marine sediment metagenome TaxID=412755 RepID=A0A0F9VB92_9ZZZZ